MLFLLASLLITPGIIAAEAVAETDFTKPAPLATQLRELEKQITAVRGLAFKAPVNAKIVPRPKEANASVQGYYSTTDKTFFLFDDIKGNYQEGVLIHEMVHALQDQHFGLAKLKKDSEGTDAQLALEALIEGDATYTMIEVLKDRQPRAGEILNVALEKAKDLERAFTYAQGSRYVKALKDKGGWKAVDSAYRFPPSSTATILHQQRMPHVDLSPGKTVGELGVIKLLLANPATQAQAFTAAQGWRGDSRREFKEGVAWTVAFATEKQAEAFRTSMAQVEKDSAAVSQRGTRVLVLQNAADAAALRRLRDRVEGPPQLTVFDSRTKKTISFAAMMERLHEADLICIGETHDSDLHHRVQHHLLKALFACDERLGVGMEMFQRPFQKIVDDYVAANIAEEEFLSGTEYGKRWGFDWSLYRPIVEFCRRNKVPLAALNAPQELTRQLSKLGYDSLKDEEKKQLAGVDFHVKEHRDYWYERLSKMHGNANAKPEEKERSYRVMTTWDGYMAESAALFQQSRDIRRMLIIAGSGHIERGFGIPNRAAAKTGGRAVTITVRVGTYEEPKEIVADYVIFAE